MKVEKNKIILDKVLNNLDIFTLDFTKILEKHCPYVLISGYVAILFGRSRISEDIDIMTEKMSKKEFKKLYEDLKNEFWCLNAESVDELYDMLLTNHSIRFAKKEKVIPNMEMKFLKNIIDENTLKNRIEVKMGENSLFVSPIELQVTFKEKILKSKKDIEDALHLREVFKDHISTEKIKYYEGLLDDYA